MAHERDAIFAALSILAEAVRHVRPSFSTVLKDFVSVSRRDGGSPDLKSIEKAFQRYVESSETVGERDAHDFFSNFRPRPGERLSNKALDRLKTIHADIPLGSSHYKNFEAFNPLTGGSPLAFWIGPFAAEQPLRNYDELLGALSRGEGDDKSLVPIRRRIRQSLLSKVIDREASRLQSDGVELKRGQMYLTLARGNDDNTKKADLCGRRWRLLEQEVGAAMLIGLDQTTHWETWRYMSGDEIKALAAFFLLNATLPNDWNLLSRLVLTLQAVLYHCLSTGDREWHGDILERKEYRWISSNQVPCLIGDTSRSELRRPKKRRFVEDQLQQCNGLAAFQSQHNAVEQSLAVQGSTDVLSQGLGIAQPQVSFYATNPPVNYSDFAADTIPASFYEFAQDTCGYPLAS